MVRVFPPSTIPHPWRATLLPLLAIAVWMLLLVGVLDGIAWLAIHVGSWHWSFVPVTA